MFVRSEQWTSLPSDGESVMERLMVQIMNGLKSF